MRLWEGGKERKVGDFIGTWGFLWYLSLFVFVWTIFVVAFLLKQSQQQRQ